MVEDLVIIGSGAAAMSAAIYAARDQRRPLLLEKANVGGLTAIISQIENYPGFHGDGATLMQTMREQAESFGARFQYGECTRLERLADGSFALEIDGDPEEKIFARTVIVATGTERKHLGIPGEELAGVSYCATCDAPLTKGKDVIVVGGGNSAVQEALYLLKFCNKITLLVRSELRCDEALKRRLAEESRIELVRACVPVSIHQAQDSQLLLRSKSGNEYLAGHIFIFIGLNPSTAFLPAELLDQDACVKSDAQFMTAMPGLFVAGDCHAGSWRQTIVAAGEGASAALYACRYLEEA